MRGWHPLTKHLARLNWGDIMSSLQVAYLQPYMVEGWRSNDYHLEVPTAKIGSDPVRRWKIPPKTWNKPIVFIVSATGIPVFVTSFHSSPANLDSGYPDTPGSLKIPESIRYPIPKCPDWRLLFYCFSNIRQESKKTDIKQDPDMFSWLRRYQLHPKKKRKKQTVPLRLVLLCSLLGLEEVCYFDIRKTIEKHRTGSMYHYCKRTWRFYLFRRYHALSIYLKKYLPVRWVPTQTSWLVKWPRLRISKATGRLGIVHAHTWT